MLVLVTNGRAVGRCMKGVGLGTGGDLFVGQEIACSRRQSRWFCVVVREKAHTSTQLACNKEIVVRLEWRRKGGRDGV